MWHVANWVKGNVLVCMFGLACSRRLVVLLVVGFVFVCVCVCGLRVGITSSRT